MAVQRRLVMLALTLAFAVACGGGASIPDPTKTPPASATPLPSSTPTTTPTTTPEFVWTPATPVAPETVEGSCTDPYPNGAPFQPTPGAPVRIRPSGSPAALQPYDLIPFSTDQELEDIIRGTLGDEVERYAIVVKNISDGTGVRLDADRVFYAASLYKTWVMLEMYHQREAGILDFAERFIVTHHYDAYGLNPGELEACDEVPVGEALRRMLSVSDNVAANLLVDVAGAGNINAALRDFGLPASGFRGDGTLPATAADMALLLEAIAVGQAVSGPASEEMLIMLASEVIGSRLAALLPAGTRIAHKTGTFNSPPALHDAGIVFSPATTYVIVVLTDFGFQGDGGAIGRLSRAVYDYYNDP